MPFISIETKTKLFNRENGPTPNQMKEFCDSFKKSDWEKLIKDFRFINFVTTDLGKANARAEEILNPKKEVPKLVKKVK